MATTFQSQANLRLAPLRRALLFILLGLYATACEAWPFQRRTTTIAAPLAFTPAQNWEGIDGSWNTFMLRVGTPQQFVRVHISTASQQTWVVAPQGCPDVPVNGTCDARGWTFNYTVSSTWDDIGYYSLWTEQNLGYDGDAAYGYDTVGLGGEGEGGPTLKNTTVGAFAVEDFYFGHFGVNPKSTNFTSFNDPSPSYMTTLREQNMIPSVSFGYTAGAQYRTADRVDILRYSLTFRRLYGCPLKSYFGWI